MLALLIVPAKSENAHNLMIIDLAIPASLTPTATSGIVYFTIMNHGPVDDDLLTVSTPTATSATLHESYQDGDVAKMRDLEAVDVPPGGLIKLQQGGKHVMLMGLRSPFKKGDKVMLKMVFAKAGEIKVEATVGDAVTGHVHAE